ncbi:heavy-metal-associated domain-containing protein [Spirosoma aureum]|uniref:Heavy-metal-associated domain-containing protein n=1 Tax=Spirosoma aureum TaxID=2692134 RepID=A0A6G9ALB9_9BACT|nr:heavy-metal-associated domain-containing protein [Spirosoma aureum]QIP13134.1 heavy-metal-associated domain-containing protein [Spirosoma aureum]
METIKQNSVRFKTNIKCGGCIATVTPYLNEAVGEGHWQVDIQDPNKVLTADTTSASSTQIKQAIEKAGYKAEPLN